MTRYLIVIEKANANYGAFAPDLPGCIALGETVPETVQNMKQAIEMHVTAMAEDGDPIPEPTTLADYIEVDVPAQPAAVPSRARRRVRKATASRR